MMGPLCVPIWCQSCAAAVPMLWGVRAGVVAVLHGSKYHDFDMVRCQCMCDVGICGKTIFHLWAECQNWISHYLIYKNGFTAGGNENRFAAGRAYHSTLVWSDVGMMSLKFCMNYYARILFFKLWDLIEIWGFCVDLPPELPHPPSSSPPLISPDLPKPPHSPLFWVFWP